MRPAPKRLSTGCGGSAIRKRRTRRRHPEVDDAVSDQGEHRGVRFRAERRRDGCARWARDGNPPRPRPGRPGHEPASRLLQRRWALGRGHRRAVSGARYQPARSLIPNSAGTRACRCARWSRMHPGSIRRQVGGESLAAPTTGPRPVVARALQYGSPVRRRHVVWPGRERHAAGSGVRQREQAGRTQHNRRSSRQPTAVVGSFIAGQCLEGDVDEDP